MKVLLVKLSSLGDVVHTLPVVQDILSAHPGAQIDWVVEKSFAPLLSPLVGAGLHRVIPCELRRWRKSPLAAATRAEWKIFKSLLQAEHYDAVIDLQGLTKSALVARLASVTATGKRYALANQTDGSGYEAPTRWVADVAIFIEPHIHAMQRSRVLSARALGYSLPPAWSYGLNPALAQSPRTKFAIKTVAFVHGTSRANKQWPEEDWVALGRRLAALGFQIALPHGSDEELASCERMAAAINLGSEGRPTTQAVIWPRLSLDALTQQLAQCAGVIGVDSGVSHIAVALDLPHVQIYNFDTAWRTGPLPGTAGGHQVSVYAQPAPTVQAVWDAWMSCAPTDAQAQSVV
ncbi:MAG TPA: lipopolysaccharide heptosyltransferase I [Polaromonas sp.]|uniref:lipopolysaccharide heptosyltransferase I n=1 Tax=Polaromonas sp. TaxID=1869339 RepID=UPI002D468F5D|nr:lipopolysaccharide heptosyltransferase I [Polaromonas sp.]HYW58139.1 lipopolysaccharide heptosyltransferase I [Polaromonas sp.]